MVPAFCRVEEGYSKEALDHCVYVITAALPPRQYATRHRRRDVF
jgi:hypothetical protein